MVERFGTDGVRGRYGQGLVTPENAQRLGWAFGACLQQGKSDKNEPLQVAVAYDPRPSSVPLFHALCSGLMSSGVNAVALGLLPTPGLISYVQEYSMSAGIMITASHNTEEDNGFKCVNAQGIKFNEQEAALLLKWYNQSIECAQVPGGMRWDRERAERHYIERIYRAVDTLQGLKLIARRRIVVDCAQGALSHLAAQVCAKLGIDACMIHNDLTKPINQHCGSLHPEALQTTVREKSADLGVAVDGDGDRLLLCDAFGTVLTGDDVLFLLATSNLGGVTPKGVVATVMSNCGLVEALNSRGIDVVLTAVGDSKVAAAMREKNYALGGEESGHIMFQPWSEHSDGLFLGVLSLLALAKHGLLEKGYTRPWKAYPLLAMDIAVDAKKQDQLLKALSDELATVALKACVIRKSGTEPKIRVRLQADSQVELDAVKIRIDTIISEGMTVTCEEAK